MPINKETLRDTVEGLDPKYKIELMFLLARSGSDVNKAILAKINAAERSFSGATVERVGAQINITCRSQSGMVKARTQLLKTFLTDFLGAADDASDEKWCGKGAHIQISEKFLAETLVDVGVEVFAPRKTSAQPSC